MSYLVRKVTRAKWSPPSGILDNPFDIPADVIAIDLKTSANTLSVWEISDEIDLDDAVLAIASGGNKLDTIDVVWIEKHELDRKGLEHIASPGRTPIEYLVNKHLDLTNLEYFKIGLVAESIASKIALNKIKRYSKGELKKLFNLAISKGLVEKNHLDEGIRNGL